MFSFFTGSVTFVKIEWILLGVLLFFTVINSCKSLNSNDGWIGLVGVYALVEESLACQYFFIVLCGFTSLIDILRIIIIAASKKIYGSHNMYWMVISIFAVITKIAIAVISFLNRNQLSQQNQNFSSSSSYSSAPSAAADSKYGAGVGSGDGYAEGTGNSNYSTSV